MRSLIISVMFLASVLSATPQELPASWWKNSSYSYDKKYQDDWLYHVEATVGYDKENGNINQEQGQYSLNGVLRYEQWSLYADYMYQQSDITEYIAKDTPTGTSKTLTIAYDTYINYDITPIIYAILGHSYYESDITFIDNRNVYYTGIGLYSLQTKTNILKIELLYGNDNIKYLAPTVSGGESNAFEIKEKYHYLYDEHISLDQMFIYVLEEKKNRNEYHFNTKFNIQVLGPISMVPYVSWDHYESLKLVNMYEDDVKYGVYLKIEF